MAFIYEQSGSWTLRMYSSVSIATGNPIIDDGNQKPLREKDGSLASRSLGLAVAGQAKYRRLMSQAGKPIRVQQSIKICDRDGDRFKSDKSLAVIALAAELETRVREWEETVDLNDGTVELRPDGNMSVRDFFDNVFMPHVKKNKEAATYESYAGIYKHYLADFYNHATTLRGFEAFRGTALLSRLAATYSDSVVNNARALSSTIFKHACALGYIKNNPWREVTKVTDGQDVEEGYAYNDAEIEQIVAALDAMLAVCPERQKRSVLTAQMAVMVGYFLGLRPSETAGLRWEKVNLATMRVTIDSACVAGNFKGTKNAKVRTLDIPAPLDQWFKIWAAGKDTTSGWVFPGEKGQHAAKPATMNDLSSRIAGPACRAAGLTSSRGGDLWGSKKDKVGFYACRRGFATAMVNAGADYNETAMAMGNTPEIVRAVYYKGQESSTMASNGMAKLNEKRAQSKFAQPAQPALNGQPAPGRLFRNTPKQLEGEVNG